MATIRRFDSLTVKEVSLVSAGANQPAFVTLFKSKNRKETEMNEIEKAAADKAAADKLAADALAAETAKAEADKAAADAAAAAVELAKSQATEIEKANVDLAKAQADLAKAQADLELANSKTVETEKALKAEKRAALVVAAETRVAKTMKSLPGVQATTAANLVALAEIAPELAVFVEDAFVKASALIEKGGLAVVADVEKGAVTGSALEQAAKLTAAKRLANPKLTKAQAEAEVWRENTALYNQYETEKKAAA